MPGAHARGYVLPGLRLPAGASSSGSIWGNDIYTADSPICRAAAHAGVIGERGGIVEVRDLPGRSHFPAVTRNGIESGSWESFPRSITFRGAGDGSGIAICPDRLGHDTPALVCECTADAIGDGTVWGSDIYTDDSPICRAAVHAGVIGREGGIIDVHEAPGRDSYAATTHNGVSSSHWDSYPRSIVFRDRGDAPK